MNLWRIAFIFWASAVATTLYFTFRRPVQVPIVPCRNEVVFATKGSKVVCGHEAQKMKLQLLAEDIFMVVCECAEPSTLRALVISAETR